MLTNSPEAPLILLVEDESSHVAAITRSFERAAENYRLEIAGTLSVAREMIKRIQPTLVLTDYRLPDGNGSDLASLANGVCPIIMMTAKGSEQIAVQLLKTGIQDYVVKSADAFSHMPETVNHSLTAWRLVQARRKTEEALRRYARRLVEMEEELRKKIAAELHDEIGRDLTVLGMNISIIDSQLADDSPKNLRERIKDSTRLIEDISRTTRNMTAGLRPPVLDDYGLVSALRWHTELYAARTGIPVTVHADAPFPRLRSEVELAFFRISQEALMNTAKHAQATCASVTLKRDKGMILLTVTDDGSGGKPHSTSYTQGSGWGLTIMRERAELVGATFLFESIPGRGTSVTITMPWEEQ